MPRVPACGTLDSVSCVQIDGYMAGLAAQLRGPRRVRADLLAEARHSLLDAAEAYRAAGLPPALAEARAVAEFGPYHEVVPGYQAELAVAQGRRTALLVALALPVLQQLAPLIWWRSPWSGHGVVAPGYFRLADGFDLLALGGGVLAALVLLGFGWGSRYIRDGVRLTRVVGCGVLVFLAVHGLTGGALYYWSLAQWPAALRWPPTWVGATVMWLSFAYAAVCAVRCLDTTRRDTIRRPGPVPAG